MQTSRGCPDISGTYANQAEGSDAWLSALLLPDGAASSAHTVTLTVQREPQRLVVVGGAHRVVLDEGSDFTCEAGALRLAPSRQRRISLGSFITQDVETIHALSKDTDGALHDTTLSREHSVLYGKPVTGPLRKGATLRWRPLAPAAPR
jgi:hypothetical protein